MSDFIFSSCTVPKGELSALLADIYVDKDVAAREYTGTWGTLAVTPSMYPGYQPLETDHHICVVLGGPVLYFCLNDFITSGDTRAGTRRILKRWLSGRTAWSEELSGAFAVLIINKLTETVECITDMMMFIPVYQCAANGAVAWGTHVDALAAACGETRTLDEASLVDFVLHDAITFPFTAYENIHQCRPGSIHRLAVPAARKAEQPVRVESYWEPLEQRVFSDLDEAASYLRSGVRGYIDNVTGSMSKVAHFISAGEDSRALAGILPPRLERDSYIFLDSMNREGKIAKRVAKAYGAKFKMACRDRTHYLDILPEAADLIGSGHQYVHAHSLRLAKELGLAEYAAVFGGYGSDSLLKAQYARRLKWIGKIPFLPSFAIKGEDRTGPVSSVVFSQNVLKEVERRRVEHFHRVQKIRPETAHEWFELWPATMRVTMPNLYTNRRLFASHEIFMSKESVKTAAGAPVQWKLNRRLFHRAFKPYLSAARRIFHADGRLPYYPWWVNAFAQAPIWSCRQVVKRAGMQKKNHGAWGDWKGIMGSERWAKKCAQYTTKLVSSELAGAVGSGALSEKYLPVSAKINLLQACYHVQKHQAQDEGASHS